jgi:hypothetical protein
MAGFFPGATPYDVKEDEWSEDYLGGDSLRVLRGGSFFYTQLAARCALRYGDLFLYPFGGDYGFRVVVSPIFSPSAL